MGNKDKTTAKDVFWGVFWIAFIILVVAWQFKDCGGKSKKERFIDSRMDKGHSREEAEDEYEDAAYDSQIR